MPRHEAGTPHICRNKRVAEPALVRVAFFFFLSIFSVSSAMPFPFTFTLATPGHSNPFLNPPSPPRRKSITRTSPIAKPLFNKPPTSPTAYPRSPLPSIQRRPGTIYAPSSQLTNPIPPPLSLSKKRGWEPAFTSPPKSKKMEIGITRSYFDPPVQYQEMVEDILGAAPDGTFYAANNDAVHRMARKFAAIRQADLRSILAPLGPLCRSCLIFPSFFFLLSFNMLFLSLFLTIKQC